MKIYEKIFTRLELLHMSQTELSKKTGIATSTISDWRKKRMNPQADKLVPICKALDMTLAELLCEEEENNVSIMTSNCISDEKITIEKMLTSPDDIKGRVFQYFNDIYLGLEKNQSAKRKVRNVSIIQDAEGKKIVLINDKKFKGLSKADWKEVENYLKEYVGDFYEIAYCSEKIFIDTDFPDEYSNSDSRITLKGPRRVAKANAAQAIPELIQIATPVKEIWQQNKESKHEKDAKYGWYRYNVRFGIPVYNNDGELERYNIFGAVMLVRHDEDGKKYLYDFTTIKKRNEWPA